MKQREDTREEVAVNVGGYEIKLHIEPEERRHVEKAAEQVTERLRTMTGKAGSATPAKIAAMVAFQFACDLSVANEMLDEAQNLHAELKRQKEAVQKLEGLLGKVDEALTY